MPLPRRLAGGVALGVEERARYERDLAAARSGLMQRA
jgi:hypothetical protein